MPFSCAMRFANGEAFTRPLPLVAGVTAVGAAAVPIGAERAEAAASAPAGAATNPASALIAVRSSSGAPMIAMMVFTGTVAAVGNQNLAQHTVALRF